MTQSTANLAETKHAFKPTQSFDLHHQTIDYAQKLTSIKDLRKRKQNSMTDLPQIGSKKLVDLAQ